ncbi:MAG: dephospho-CoA kinase [Verrucomicrobia bacterium]|nr:dephospho-CoA kinase [Verrucomicrobiota bacterium]
MAVIGITGSIASGKSTFRDLLVPILPARALDADAISKKLLEEDADVRSEVLAAISHAAYGADGSPDRVEIRRIIYSDAAAKSRLEAILHPRVRKIWLEEADLAREEARHLIVDIPLLFETDAARHFEFTITVACSPDVQLARLMARGLDAVLAKKIIRAQMPVPEKIARSSHVVWNDGGGAALEDQAEYFARQVRGTFSESLGRNGAGSF